MVIPYLCFHGNCEEAIEFYKQVFNASVDSIQRYNDYVPENIKVMPSNLSQWVLHAEMIICDSKFWFADETNPTTAGNMIKLSLSVKTYDEANRIYLCLAEKGIVVLPPTETFYSKLHAGVIDQYGVTWNITTEELP